MLSAPSALKAGSWLGEHDEMAILQIKAQTWLQVVLCVEVASNAVLNWECEEPPTAINMAAFKPTSIQHGIPITGTYACKRIHSHAYISVYIHAYRCRYR